MQSGNEMMREAFPVGKLVDISLRLTGDQAGFALIGALNDNEEAKALFFDNVSVAKVGFTSYLGGKGGVPSVASEALCMLEECLRCQRDMEDLRQFLLSHAHNGVRKPE